KNTHIPKLEALGWEEGQIKAMRDFMNSASGACLIAGQTGSGKSTTIASALDEVKHTGRSINTIEDPVEFDIGVMQTSVLGGNEELNDLVKLLLRHDVDIEMHGEMRTKEGAMAVCRKAETGQLMLTTLHTSSAIGIAHTMNEQMGVPLALIGAPDLMKLWIYQTLVRKLCPHCALSLDEAKALWDDTQQEQYKQWLSQATATDTMRFKNPEGCQLCYQGEKDRTTLVEMLVLDDEDRQFILSKDYLGWAEALKQKGYKTVLDHANLKIARGEI
ncbi:GspE/PulE family protein, partial [Vibrio vulnificus]|uniref:GspE/PulE family protein n=1 Tax=Vibrio vulnificus TaxID=672 RepID=UPI0010D16F4B